MIKKNTVFITVFLFLFSSFGFSLNIDFCATMDTYADEFYGGPSITITGNLLDNLVLSSAIDYNDANTYKTFCHMVYEKKRYTFGSGLGFYFSEERIYPMLYVIGSVKPINWFKLETQYTTGSNSEYFFSSTSSVNNLEITSSFFTPTADLLFYFEYENDLEFEEKTYKNKFELRAHQQDVPLRINLFSELDTIFYDGSSIADNIEILVGGGFQIDINKKTSYYVDSQITAVSLENTNQPFSISIGAKYKINDFYTQIENQ